MEVVPVLDEFSSESQSARSSFSLRSARSSADLSKSSWTRARSVADLFESFVAETCFWVASRIFFAWSRSACAAATELPLRILVSEACCWAS